MKLVLFFVLLFGFVQAQQLNEPSETNQTEPVVAEDQQDTNNTEPVIPNEKPNTNTSKPDETSAQSDDLSSENQLNIEDLMDANLFGLISGLVINLFFVVFLILIIPLRKWCKCCFRQCKCCGFATTVSLLFTLYLIGAAVFSNIIFGQITKSMFKGEDGEEFEFDFKRIVTSYSIMSSLASVCSFICIAVAIIFISIKTNPRKNLIAFVIFCVFSLIFGCAGAVTGYFYVDEHPYKHVYLSLRDIDLDKIKYELSYLFFFTLCYSSVGSSVLSIIGTVLMVTYSIVMCYRKKKGHHQSSSESSDDGCCKGGLCGCCCCCCGDKKKKKKAKVKKVKKNKKATKQSQPKKTPYQTYVDDYYKTPKGKKMKFSTSSFSLDEFEVVISIESLSSSE